MKFTLSWLKEHLDTDAPLAQITEALTDLGLEVEGVTDPAARLAPFTIARVIEAVPHPDADRLRVCRVMTDEGERQIVCGAPNARAGITVVLAKPGDYVPGIDTTLGVGRIRGVESHGMMASERELELSDEHSGIIELPSGEVGERFVDWLARNRPEAVDPVIEIKITPNRPDALGVRGVARDLAARGLGTLRPERRVTVPGRFAAPITVSIAPEVAQKAPFFAARLIRGVRNGPSPDWLRARLTAIGLRPINALVDITNFMTFDVNRPLHVFDADRLRGDLRVRPASGDEQILALDGRSYQPPAGTLLIADEAGPQSIAGIMGGEQSGCSDQTVNVLVESALWDPIAIATAGRAMKIVSDARYRFERGVDPDFTLPGLELATQMILDLCGGEPSDITSAGTLPDTTRSYPLDPARLVRLVGMDIPEAEQRRTLEALGFRLKGDRVFVPGWRPDIQGSADLVEEVARVASLSRLEGKPLPRPAPGVPRPVLTPLQRREGAARRMAASLGYNECVSYSFIDQAAATLFGGGSDALRIENPISSEMTHMRPDLLPGLLAAAARNQARGQADLALFECGPVFFGGEPGEQDLHLSGLLVGATAPRDPHGSRRKVDVHDARADAEAVLQAVGAPARAQINRKLDAWWHPGRAGNIALGTNTLATFGEIHPRILRHFGIRGPAVGFTVRIGAVPLPKTRSPSRPALVLSDLPAVERDFAFVVDPRTEAATLVNAAAGADKALIERVSVFDQFTGLEDGRKSIAITVRMQPRDHTLTEPEIEAVSARVIEKVTKATGGVLRG